MSDQGPLQWVALAVLGALTWSLFRVQQASALANKRNLTQWLVLGAALVAVLAFLVDTGSLVVSPIAAALLVLWAAPAISLATSRSLRLMTSLEHALNRRDFATAERLLGEAAAAVRASSPVDLEWNRIQLCQLEGRLRMAQNRAAEAAAPLAESYLLARNLGVSLYVAEAGNLLLKCRSSIHQSENAEPYVTKLEDLCHLARGLSSDSQAMHVSDSAASAHGEPVDTISPRTL